MGNSPTVPNEFLSAHGSLSATHPVVGIKLFLTLFHNLWLFYVRSCNICSEVLHQHLSSDNNNARISLRKTAAMDEVECPLHRGSYRNGRNLCESKGSYFYFFWLIFSSDILRHREMNLWRTLCPKSYPTFALITIIALVTLIFVCT